jgi:hypothetical protein
MHGLVGSCYIDVTGVAVVERSQFEAAIARLVASHSLHGSESLCKLLRYLAKQALEHPGVQVKEYQIATEVLGRQANFDPQLDSMVRVQAGRLRAKLTEYYSTEGASDPYMVELPKGSYAVVFHERSRSAQPNGVTTDNREVAWKARENGENHWLVPILSAALLMALALIGWLTLGRRGPGPIVSASANAAAVPYRTFWDGFVTVQEEPWVIFSNAAFVGRPDTGMRYYDAAKDGKAPILDHYTGVGEVLAVHNLDQVFAILHQTLRVKRGSLFSLDDAKNNDLIFIGSPSENLTLLDVPSTKEFVFRKVTDGPRAGNMEIVNVHPGKGESSTYLATANVPLTEDYAVVALVRGLNPEHSELILAGTTTIGTQAAVEFVTRENYLNNLLDRMKVRKPSDLKPFEAVIQVKVARGVPVESSLVALRVLDK